VSDATVLRFVRTAGFADFKTFKIALAAELLYPREAIFESVLPSDGPQTLIQKVAGANMQVIKDTLYTLDPGALQKAVRLIRRAQRIFVCAVGTSIPMAAWLCDRFFRLGLNALAISDPHYLYTQAAIAGEGDVFFFISRSGRPAELVKIIKVISKTRPELKKILLTCDGTSPLAKFADINLLGVSREIIPEIAGTAVSIATIIDIIYTSLELADYDRAAKYQKKIREAGTLYGNKRYDVTDSFLEGEKNGKERKRSKKETILR
jgi:DNA-binding MurR/RpiR family transcriptional regulator